MMRVKKIIFLSVSLVILIVSLVLSINNFNIKITTSYGSEKINSTTKAEKIMKSLNNMMKKDSNNSDSYEEIDFKNMTISEYSQYSIFVNNEYREYASRDEKEYFVSRYNKAKVKRNMNIYFTETATYYDIDLILTSTYESAEISNEIRTVNNTIAFCDISMDIYIQSDATYLRFNKLIICEYYKNKDGKNGDVIDLIDDKGVDIAGKWIDISNSMYLSDMIEWTQDFNLSFFDNIQESIAEYNRGGDSFIRQGNVYKMNDEKYRDLLNSISSGESIGALEAKKIKGGLDLSINEEELLLDLVFKYADTNKVHTEKYYEEVNVDCVEEDEIKILDINKTKIEEISKEDVLVYDDIEQLLKDVIS